VLSHARAQEPVAVAYSVRSASSGATRRHIARDERRADEQTDGYAQGERIDSADAEDLAPNQPSCREAGRKPECDADGRPADGFAEDHPRDASWFCAEREAKPELSDW
jgi:hypothetical protein